MGTHLTVEERKDREEKFGLPEDMEIVIPKNTTTKSTYHFTNENNTELIVGHAHISMEDCEIGTIKKARIYGLCVCKRCINSITAKNRLDL